MQMKYHFGKCKHSHFFYAVLPAVLPHSYIQVFILFIALLKQKNPLIIKKNLKGAIFKILLIRQSLLRTELVAQ